MGLVPTKTKFRKHQRMRLRGKAERGNAINFGEFGLQSMECAHITVNQIEAARKALTHYLKRGGKVWVRAFADKIKTARAAETRMGGGKGAPDKFVAAIKRGHVLFELAGIPLETAREAFRRASYKLPIETRFIMKG